MSKRSPNQVRKQHVSDKPAGYKHVEPQALAPDISPATEPASATEPAAAAQAARTAESTTAYGSTAPQSAQPGARVEPGMTPDGRLFHTKTVKQVQSEREQAKTNAPASEEAAPTKIDDAKIIEAVKKDDSDEASLREAAERLREIIAILYEHKAYRGITPQSLREICEGLGATFVKLGQIMSMRSDMLPKEYCEELVKLRSDVEPMTREEVTAVLENEYGQPLTKIFSEFKSKPIGSASVAQAHIARLYGSDAKVVVKVQRPGIRETMERDISLLHKASGLLKLTEIGGMFDFNAMLDEMWEAEQQEMDFRIEAQHINEFREKNKSFTYIDCPQVDHAHTTAHVLVMEQITGFRIDDVEGLNAAGYDVKEIAAKLAENYIAQILEAGYFHADPHPGNIFVRDGKIVYIDFGMMGRLSQRDRKLISEAVSAFVKHDVQTLKRVVMTMGVCKERPDQFELTRTIEHILDKYSNADLGNLDLGNALTQLTECAKSFGISLPNGYAMLGRSLITIEGVLTAISPESNLMELAAARTVQSAAEKVDVNAELKKGLSTLWLNSEKLVNLPVQASTMMDMMINGESKINFDLTGSEKPLSELGHMSDRIVKGLIIAALIVGSSWMTSLEGRPEILGLPVHAFIGFAIALVMALKMAYDSNKTDGNNKK